MTTDRDGPRSNPYHPDPMMCCEACTFGRGEHAEWCERDVLRCEQLDERDLSCGKPAVARCLDFGLAMCAAHAEYCRKRSHRLEAIE